MTSKTEDEWMTAIREDKRSFAEQMQDWNSPLGQHVKNSDLYKKWKESKKNGNK